ncbi:hypothetical protein SAMN05421812_101107 [Asanoa hainanensis]|uniref:Uncharacterized protein n=1 Tax=Asanoa hainanensis TaxID=560556 RepID=A0A239FWP0_9ACTN|nr:hypothetical protein [Asanoa hainanensis]SNS61155.1 hypothetical protein SAMN05421812_101107 [Asanoa hainanensis]
MTLEKHEIDQILADVADGKSTDYDPDGMAGILRGIEQDRIRRAIAAEHAAAAEREHAERIEALRRRLDEGDDMTFKELHEIDRFDSLAERQAADEYSRRRSAEAKTLRGQNAPGSDNISLEADDFDSAAFVEDLSKPQWERRK